MTTTTDAPVSDHDDKDRPEIRAEFTLNKHVQEILSTGIPTTRRARVMTAVELIRARVAEAYGLSEVA